MKLCIACGKTISTSNFSRHMKICVVEELECAECSARFTRKDSLVRHLKRKHSGERTKSFKCLRCPKKYSDEQYLKAHVRKKHENTPQKKSKETTCNICWKTYKNWRILNEHRKNVHRERIKTCNLSFECSECNKEFAAKKYLQTHIKRIHEQQRSYECFHCSRKCSTKYALRVHIQKWHTANSKEKANRYKCLKCDHDFNTVSTIQDHYKKEHDIKFEFEELKFESFAKFEEWKTHMQQDTVTQSRVYNNWETSECIVRVFVCHRSGIECWKTTRKKMPRKIGSKKLGGYCPMEIVVKENKIDGICVVRFQKTHVGHTTCNQNELKFISLSTKEKENLATKLKAGVPKDILIMEYKSKYNQDKATRLDILSYDDVFNVARSLNMDKNFEAPSEDDLINVETFVLNNFKSVLFFKPVGHEDVNFGTLTNRDFLLVYMDEFQEKQLLRYSHKVVAFDDMHGTIPYKYILHTLFIIDVDREGIPVAFCITNRNDKVCIDIFLDCIKQRVGIIKTQTLITNMQVMYQNSWEDVMGQVKDIFFYSWHVHEVWRRNLSKISIKNEKENLFANVSKKRLDDKKELVRAQLDDLANELDENLFEEKLDAFLSNDDDDLQDFINYFSTTYVRNKKYWAHCYRKHAVLVTNTYIESFHKTLKYRLVGGKKITSLYDSLCLLQHYCNYKGNENENKDIPGSVCQKTKRIRDSHKKAEEQFALKEKSIILESISDSCWLISSFQDTDDNIVEMYTIQKLEIKECSQYTDIECHLLCQICGICFHQFICSCPDNAIKNNMCVHIHALVMYPKQFETAGIEEDDNSIQEYSQLLPEQ